MIISISAYQVINIINMVIAIVFALLYFMQNVHLIVGTFTKHKKFKPAKKLHKYAYFICARNEETVIGNLIDSIYTQNYPRELMQVFVCADNCTDNTKGVAESHGAIVYERHSETQKGKCYALDLLIKNVLKDSNYNDIEAFFVFDADNLLSKDYTKHMNDTFDAGFQVSTSFRDSKNFTSSLSAACSSVMFYRECLLVHHSRQNLHLGTFISGTGYFVDRKIFETLGGWDFRTLTEDIEFSCYCAKENIKISYNEEAIFYDEQPNKLHDANKQRFRWCKGTHQCNAKYGAKLFGRAFGPKKRSLTSRISCFEMFVHVFPAPIITTTWFVIYMILQTVLYLCGLMSNHQFVYNCILTVLFELLAIFGIAILHAIICTIKYWKHIPGKGYHKIAAMLMFPLFVALYIPLSYKALFTKTVRWDAIPHTESIKIDDLEKQETK